MTEARLPQSMKQLELLAKLQLTRIDISMLTLSLPEKLKRPETDIDHNALADILNVSVVYLLGQKE